MCIKSLSTMQHIDDNPQGKIIFSYDNLSISERHTLQQAAQAIKENITTTIRAIWEIGQKLVEVRGRLEENVFGAWLQSEFEWSRRTAYHYINVYQAFPQFDTENCRHLDIDISALYLLAAPSTSSELRSHFFARAKSGQRVRYKDVKASLQQAKVISISEDLQFEPEVISAESIVTPKLILECEADEYNPKLIATAMEESISALHPMWNLVNKNFFLFWGDITSHRFDEHLPDEAFVLATPDTTGQQTWLVKNTRSLIAMDKSQLDQKIVSGFLEVIANGQKAIVFPWLPHWKIVNIALELNLMVYVADADLRHCERLLSQLGFDLQRIQRIL